MSLQHIADHCAELLDLTNARWHKKGKEEQSKAVERVDELKGAIESLMMRHNRAVMRLIRNHHEDAKIDMAALEASERFRMIMEEFDLVAANAAGTIDEPTDKIDREAMLATLPAKLRLAHRYATVVRRDALALLSRAEIVHSLNRSGSSHVERVPMPDDGTDSYVIGNA